MQHPLRAEEEIDVGFVLTGACEHDELGRGAGKRHVPLHSVEHEMSPRNQSVLHTLRFALKAVLTRPII